MSRLLCALAGLLLALAGCSQPEAKDGPQQPDEARRADPARAQRIDVEVESLRLSAVMAGIAKQTGRTIEVDPAIDDETLSVSLKDVEWRQAVEIIATMARAAVADLPGGKVLVTHHHHPAVLGAPR